MGGVWGTVPQWIGLSAAAVALAAFVMNRRDRSRESASLVYIVYESSSFKPRGDSGRAEPRLELEVTLRNDSPGPITDGSLALFAPGRKRRLWWLHDRSSRWWTGDRIFGNALWMITPGSSPNKPFEYVGTYPYEQALWEYPPVLLKFTDGAGRRWVRWPDGRLSRVHGFLQAASVPSRVKAWRRDRRRMP